MNLNRVILFAMLCMFLASAASAINEGKGTILRWGKPSKGLEACREDIGRWCKEVVPGGGRIGHCLHARFGELSISCLSFARHGGKGHEMESLMDIDRVYDMQNSTSSVSGKGLK